MKAQLVYLSLTVLSLGISIAKHGEPRTPHNCLVEIIGITISLSLLYWGGFFDGLIKVIF
jgi:hypothetical protein